MTVRRIITVVAALLALILGASCNDRVNEVVTAETDDPFYLQGQQLNRQGRNP